MNPFVVLTAVIGAAAAAPAAQYPLVAGAPALAAGPVSYAAAAPVVAAAPAISVPAPYTTQQVQGAPAVSVHQPAPQVTKQVHYADQTFVAGYNTRVLKPAIPDFRISVPTALKGTQQVTAPIVSVQKEPYVVNEPYPVDRPYDAPYDVVKNVQKVVEVPHPVHVTKPYPVAVPVPVRGQDIVKYTQGAPIVHHSHENRVAAPIIQNTYAASPAFSQAAVLRRY